MNTMENGVQTSGSTVMGAGEWMASNGSSVREDLVRSTPYEFSAEVLEGTRYHTMRKMVNAWTWHEGYGQGGENPYRHPDGYIPVYGPNGGTEFVMVVVQGLATGRWYVVKCDPQQVTAREFNRLTGRAVARRVQTNRETGAKWEVPYLWLEPMELFIDRAGVAGGWINPDVASWDSEQADDAVQHAKHWASELRQQWAMDGEGWGNGNEVLVSPERMGWLQRAQSDDDGQALLDEVLDRVARFEQLGDDAATA